MTEKRRDVYDGTEGDRYEDLPDILTPAEVGNFFRSQRTQVAKWLKNGDLPNAFKIGGGWRIPKKDVYDLTMKLYGTGTKRETTNDQS